MDITITPLDVADDDAAARAYEILVAAETFDLPDFPPHCRQRFFGGLRHPFPGSETRHALAHLDGVPAGYLRLELPQLDNTDNASIEIDVHPDHRRRGVGRALHEHAVQVVRGLGRKWISSASVAPLADGPTRPEPGTGFAQAVGAKLALVEVRRRLDVTTVDQAALDRLLDDARSRSEGYSLVRWGNVAPDEYVDDVAYLDGRLLSDAPMGDLAWGAEKIDAARVRATEAALLARGRRSYSAGMRHDGTGRLVAWTRLDLTSSTPWHSFQQITLVDPEHRGHRLGTIAKIENLRYALAHEPELRMIDTWNAASNSHMISINEAMGFRPVDNWNNWQLAV